MERLYGDVLNLFGGIVRLPNAIHNDINATLLHDGELNRDACDLAAWLDMESKFDVVVVDPPFSAHQAVVSYGIKKAQKITHARDVVEYVLKPSGRVISLGYNSTGMSESRGFKKEALALINHGGSHTDMICLSEMR
jgi:16S rRNA G966 N2-methylase RsmD